MLDKNILGSQVEPKKASIIYCIKKHQAFYGHGLLHLPQGNKETQ